MTTRDVGVIQTHRRTRNNREVKLMSWRMSHNHLEASIKGGDIGEYSVQWFMSHDGSGFECGAH